MSDSRMSTHLANERTLLAWLRTSAAFFSIGLAFAKVDAFQDDVASVVFVLTGMLTFAVGCLRYYTVKGVLETKDSDFKSAQGFSRVGASRLLFAAVVAFAVAAFCVLYQAVAEVSTVGQHFGQSQSVASPVSPSNLRSNGQDTAEILRQILHVLNSSTAVHG